MYYCLLSMFKVHISLTEIELQTKLQKNVVKHKHLRTLQCVGFNQGTIKDINSANIQVYGLEKQKIRFSVFENTCIQISKLQHGTLSSSSATNFIFPDISEKS